MLGVSVYIDDLTRKIKNLTYFLVLQVKDRQQETCLRI